jgi:hypothetical protein
MSKENYDECGRKYSILESHIDSNGNKIELRGYDGRKIWMKNGHWHKDNQPALIYSDGEKRWYKDNKSHRENGPAISITSGYKQWWYEGRFITEKSQEDFERWLKLRLFM